MKFGGPLSLLVVGYCRALVLGFHATPFIPMASQTRCKMLPLSKRFVKFFLCSKSEASSESESKFMNFAFGTRLFGVPSIAPFYGFGHLHLPLRAKKKKNILATYHHVQTRRF